MSAKEALARVRGIVSSWPEVSERLSHGHPTFWGGKKTFASFHDGHHGDGRISVWVKSVADVRDDLVASNPDVFYVPPYVGPSGWLGVRLDRDVPDALLRDLLLSGYRAVAPKRALKLLDGGPGAS